MVVGARDEKAKAKCYFFQWHPIWRRETMVPEWLRIGKTDDKNVYMWECPDFFPISDDNEFLFLFFHHKENALKVINTVISF